MPKFSKLLAFLGNPGWQCLRCRCTVPSGVDICPQCGTRSPSSSPAVAPPRAPPSQANPLYAPQADRIAAAGVNTVAPPRATNPAPIQPLDVLTPDLLQFVQQPFPQDWPADLHCTINVPNSPTTEVALRVPVGALQAALRSLCSPQPPPSVPSTNPFTTQPNSTPQTQRSAPPPLTPPPLPQAAGVTAGGRLVGAVDTFAANTANAGAAGGEAAARGDPSTRPSAAAASSSAPRLRAKEVISLDELRSQLGKGLDDQIAVAEARALAGGQLGDGGGVRVNSATTTGVVHDAAGVFETEVQIDSGRHPHGHFSDGVVVRAARSGSRPSTVRIPYEGGAVGTKLRNAFRVCGERISEVDHFVESVQTPIVRLVGPEGEGGARREGVDAEGLETLDARAEYEHELLATTLRDCRRQRSLVTSAGGVEVLLSGGVGIAQCTLAEPVKASTGTYADLFTHLLSLVFRVLNTPLAMQSVVLYHMPSVRSVELSCAVSEGIAEGPIAPGAISIRSPGAAQSASSLRAALAVNLLPLIQGNVCELNGGDVLHPIRITQDAFADVMVYWTQRVAAALRVAQLRGVTSYAGLGATGMYDAAARLRLADVIEAYCGPQGSAGRVIGALRVPVDMAYVPPPVVVRRLHPPAGMNVAEVEGVAAA